MTERKEFETRSTAEIFGFEAAIIGSMSEINTMYKVAETYEEFVEALESNGLGVNAGEIFEGIFGIITKGGEGLDFPFHYFPNPKEKGVWISDIEWYKRLMKVAEQ